jgi:hypothetical protein
MAGPTAEGSVPQAPQQQQQQQVAASGIDEVMALQKQSAMLNQQILDQTKKAITTHSVSGAVPASLGSKLNFSVGQPQFAPAQGSRDARNQGIAKTVAGVANIIGGVIKAKNAEHTRVLSTKIETVMRAQDSVSQAQQVLQADPNNADAKKAITDGRQQINDIFGDPKNQKQLEKAFSIDHLDPSKNTGPEHDARKMATKNYADEIQKKALAQQQQSQLEKQKLDLMSQQKAAVDAQIKAYVPLVTQQMREGGLDARKQAELDQKQGQHEDHERQENQRHVQSLIKDLQVASDHDSTATKNARIRVGGMLQATQMRVDAQKDLFEKKLTAVKAAGEKPAAKMKVLLDYQKQLSALSEQSDKQIDANNKLGRKIKDDETKEIYWSSNRAWEATKKQSEDELKRVNGMMEQYAKTGTFPTEAAGDSGKIPTAPGGPADDTEDEGEDNPDKY